MTCHYVFYLDFLICLILILEIKQYENQNKITGEIYKNKKNKIIFLNYIIYNEKTA